MSAFDSIAVVRAAVKDAPMATIDGSAREPQLLTLANDPPLALENESDLHTALGGLLRLGPGQRAVLARGPTQFIKAVRHNDLWAVTTRNGGFFTQASFSAALSTDYSDREVKESRAAKTIWRRIRRSIISPPPERSLTTAQVQTLFAEFFLGKRFSIPQSGA